MVIIIQFLKIFMKNIFTKIILFLVILFVPASVMAQNGIPNISWELNNVSSSAQAISSEHRSDNVQWFKEAFIDYFIVSDSTGKEAIDSIFFNIAFNIKNIFLVIAVIFLIIGVINLFLEKWNDSAVTKWKHNIIYTTVGIMFLQISFLIWENLLYKETVGVNGINANISWQFWNNIISPIIAFLQWGASFAFLAMMFYAFYMIIAGGGDEDKLKKWKSTFFTAIIGFMMINVPFKLVSLLYGWIPECNKSNNYFTYAVSGCKSNTEANLSGVVDLVSSFFRYFNWFLTLACVIMAIYAGFLYMTSGSNEDNIKKAKNIIIYIAIGLLLLVLSHAIFVFFFNAGATK